MVGMKINQDDIAVMYIISGHVTCCGNELWQVINSYTNTHSPGLKCIHSESHDHMMC